MYSKSLLFDFIFKHLWALGFLLIIIGWGESGNVVLQASISVFRALSKKFSGKNGSAP